MIARKKQRPKHTNTTDMPPMTQLGTNWTAGSFRFLFKSMGKGDCTLITCPDGKHILIDCGVRGYETDTTLTGQTVDQDYLINDTLKGRYGLNHPGTDRNRLHALVLTHPDEDHYNYVYSLLNKSSFNIGTSNNYRTVKYPEISVDSVYYSDTKSQDSDTLPVSRYKRPSEAWGSLSWDLQNRCRVKAVNVTLNPDKNETETWTVPFSKNTKITDSLDDSFLTIHDGFIDDSNESTYWYVAIIAGNVPKTGDESTTDDNAGSLVTMVKIGNETALIMGDATISTEDYLLNVKDSDLNALKNEFKNITILQVPHHGSETSSSKDFVNWVNPEHVVISVKNLEHNFHHPRKTVIERYFNGSRLDTQNTYTVHYWEELNKKAVKQIGSSWGSNWIQMDNSQTHSMRSDINTNNWSGYLGVQNEGTLALYQAIITKSIQLTGIQQDIWFWMDGNLNNTNQQ